jgi:capsule polysaccharide export protein KpsE/RkpR
MSKTLELFRSELMKRHSDDWDMETIAEAAHICAEASEAHEQERIREARIDELKQFFGQDAEIETGLAFRLSDRLKELQTQLATLKGGTNEQDD